MSPGALRLDNKEIRPWRQHARMVNVVPVGGPANDIAPVRPDIDSTGDLACRGPHAWMVRHQIVQPAGLPGRLNLGFGQDVNVVVEPVKPAGVRVDIQHVEPGYLASRDADQHGLRVAEQIGENSRVLAGVLEPIGAGQRLSVFNGKTGQRRDSVRARSSRFIAHYPRRSADRDPMAERPFPS